MKERLNLKCECVKTRVHKNKYSTLSYVVIDMTYTKYNANKFYNEDLKTLEDHYKTVFTEKIKSANGMVYITLKDNLI